MLWVYLSKKDARIIYKDLKNKQFNSINEIEKRQFDQIKNVLNFSYKHIPYYREMLLDCGMVKNNQVVFNSIKDLSKIKFLDKKIIKKQKSRIFFKAHKNRKSFYNTSGGSTGEPILLMQDNYFLKHSMANFWLVLTWRKIKYYNSTYFLWGASRDKKNTFRNKLSRFIYNTDFVSTSKLNNDDKIKIISDLNLKKPDMIIAYVQSIYDLSLFAEKNNIKVLPQKIIHTGAGMLYDFMRQKIETIFGCKIYNHYGSREVSSIATECSAHDGLHILSDFNFVEIINSEGIACEDGEIGEVVITTLTNFSMPLIRYRIGDLAKKQVYAKCICGVNYPKLKEINGRTSDNFYTSKGETISGEFLTLQFNFIKGIDSFQIIQNNFNSLKVILVVNKEYDKESIEIKTKAKFLDLFGEDLILDIDYSDYIEKTLTGKHLFTINNMDLNNN